MPWSTFIDLVTVMNVFDYRAPQPIVVTDDEFEDMPETKAWNSVLEWMDAVHSRTLKRAATVDGGEGER